MVGERLTAVRRRIGDAERRSGRPPGAVTLVAVSKGHPVAAIAAAYDLGQRDFGENRADEMASKATQLPGDIRWHFVGTLQSRKVKVVRPHTTLLHSMDRPSLLRAWSAGDDDPVPPVLVQVNLAGEAGKHGAAPGEVAGLVDAVVASGVECHGLMIIPPLPERPPDSRRWFDELARMRSHLAEVHPLLTELSMGMTDDLEVAVEAGATLVRVGRAIFGERDRTVQRWDPVGERGT